jgi:hypothetical protein
MRTPPDERPEHHALPGFGHGAAWCLARLPGALARRVQDRLPEGLRLPSLPVGAALCAWPPRHLERVDPSWFAEHPTQGPLRPGRTALLGLPAAVQAAAAAAAGIDLAAGAAVPEPLARAAARWCFGHLVDLPAERPSPGPEPDPSPRDLAAWPGPTLLALAAALGAQLVGRALGRLPERAAATALLAVPEAFHRFVVDGRREAARAPAHREDLAPLLRPLAPGADPAERLVALGAPRVGEYLRRGSTAARWQAAQLLPVPAARHLLVAAPGPLPDLEAQVAGVLAVVAAWE